MAGSIRNPVRLATAGRFVSLPGMVESTSWFALPVTRQGQGCIGIEAWAPECSFRRPRLRGTSAGEPVVEPGSKAVGTGSLDGADGVVR